MWILSGASMGSCGLQEHLGITMTGSSNIRCCNSLCDLCILCSFCILCLVYSYFFNKCMYIYCSYICIIISNYIVESYFVFTDTERSPTIGSEAIQGMWYIYVQLYMLKWNYSMCLRYIGNFILPSMFMCELL